MASGSAFFAGENLRADRWTFAVCKEENSSCVVPRWVACPRRMSGVTRGRPFPLIELKPIGGTMGLTKRNARMDQRCERRLVTHDWGHS